MRQTRSPLGFASLMAEENRTLVRMHNLPQKVCFRHTGMPELKRSLLETRQYLDASAAVSKT